MINSIFFSIEKIKLILRVSYYYKYKSIYQFHWPKNNYLTHVAKPPLSSTYTSNLNPRTDTVLNIHPLNLDSLDYKLR